MKIYLVGGAVRDSLLGLSVRDKDWLVVGSTPKEMLKKKFQQVGRDFPVFIHPVTYEEYALARTERKNGVGYGGFAINFSSNVTLEEDLIRRDLTINAMAKNNSGNIIDLFQGQKDLKNRVLRHVSPAFQEDPLRVLRVARFAAAFAHLGFTIAKETFILMKSMCRSKELLSLVPERVWKETKKGICTSHPHVFFQILHGCHALNYLFPEIVFFYKHICSFYNLITYSRIIKNGYKEIFRISRISTDVIIRFSYFFQFFSRFYNIPNISTKDYFFYKEPACLIENLCKRLKVSIKTKRLAILMCGFHNFLQTIQIQHTELIINFFNIIDVWRNPKILNKFVYLKFYYSNVCIINKKNISLGKLLLKMFDVIKNISISSIKLKNRFQGIEIRNELNRLRTNRLEKWRFLNNRKIF